MNMRRNRLLLAPMMQRLLRWAVFLTICWQCFMARRTVVKGMMQNTGATDFRSPQVLDFSKGYNATHSAFCDFATQQKPLLPSYTFAFRLRLFLRACYLLTVFSPLLATFLLAIVSETFRRKVWYPMLVFSLSKSGPAFIKWSQWASTRGDLFPAILCDQLASMQSSAPTHSFAYTQASLLASFKDSSISLVERLKDIESRPVASGSIAQVHRAHMFLTSPNDPPHTVAVKVRHPQVVQLLQLDFELMQMLAKFCDSFPSLQHLRVSETLTQFSNTLAAQTDLRLEACHLAQLRRYFKASSSVFKNTYDHGTSHSSNHGTSPSTITSFPEPIFATEDILIESFEEGEGVAQLAKRLASSSQLIPRNGPLSLIQGHRYLQQSEDEDLAYFVVTHGEFVYLQMLLRDRFMHADLHPGNILLRRQQHRHPYDQPNQASEPVTTNSIYAKGIHTHSSPSSSTSHTEPSSLVLTLVDAGLVARMTVDEQERFVELLRAIAEGDGNVAARALLSFSSNNAAYLSPTDVATFTTEIVALFSQVARGYGTHTVLGDVLRGALVIMQRHRVRVDANYATLVVNALCLDGLATTMLPGYNVLDGARQLFSLHKVVTKVVPRRWQPKALRMLFPFAAWLKERSDRAWRKAQRRQAQLSHQEY